MLSTLLDPFVLMGSIMPMFWGSCVTFLLLWLWVLYLETAKIPETRTMMLAAFVIIQICELPSCFWLSSFTPYVLWACDYCGMLDALLRYPLVKDVDDMLNIKVIVLLMAKSLVIAFDFKDVDKHPLWFIWMLFYCGWGVPMIYVMSLPLHDCASAELDRHRDSVRDMSIFAKTYHLCFARGNSATTQQIRHDARMSFEWGVGILNRTIQCIPGLRNRHKQLPRWQPQTLEV